MKYITKDGKIFESEEDALLHETDIEKEECQRKEEERKKEEEYDADYKNLLELKDAYESARTEYEEGLKKFYEKHLHHEISIDEASNIVKGLIGGLFDKWLYI